MKKIILFGVLIFVASVCAVAQSKMFRYRFPSEIEKELERDTTLWKYQIRATEFSFVGDYRKTRETWDKQGVRAPVVSAADSAYLMRFAPVDARNYILERSCREKIIIINEAHTYPVHRAFTRSLLQGLYDNGYRYLGLEALWLPLMTDLKEFTLDSGYYTREPEFGNLIATALQIGFTLFGYENFDKKGNREEIQAHQIADFMQAHPDGKVLIHCGHDHVIEGTPNITRWGKAMAGRLKDMTGIDPFTISQTLCLDKSRSQYNHPYVDMVNRDYPVIMVDVSGKTFEGHESSDQVDCAIIHPAVKYIHGRPDWMLRYGERHECAVQLPTDAAFPLLVLAYRVGDFDRESVPADIVCLECAGEHPPLVLQPGQYDVVILDRNYLTALRYTTHIQ